MSEPPLDYFESEDRRKKQPSTTLLFRRLKKANIFVFPTILLVMLGIYNLKEGGNILGQIMGVFAFYLLWIAIVASILFIGVWLVVITLTALKIIKAPTEDIEYQIALFLSNIGLWGYIFIENFY